MIAKFRKYGHPGEWWLTDFTMEQVEGRLKQLEAAFEMERKACAAKDAEIAHARREGQEAMRERAAIAVQAWGVTDDMDDHARLVEDIRALGVE